MGNAGIRLAFVVGMLVVSAGVAQAQRPPKYIRTPKVEVYIDPWGGKHIRTPYKEIHKPGRIPAGYLGPPAYVPSAQLTPAVEQSIPGPAVPHPAVAASGDEMPSDIRARAELYKSAATLKRSLQALSSGASWQQYLGLTTGGVLDPNQRVTVAANPAAELAIMLGRFESVSENPEYASIAALPGFFGTRNLLQEYLVQYSSEAEAPAEELPQPQPARVPSSRLQR